MLRVRYALKAPLKAPVNFNELNALVNLQPYVGLVAQSNRSKNVKILILTFLERVDGSTTHRQNSRKVLNIFMRGYFLIQNRPKLLNILTKTHDLIFFMQTI